MFHNQFSQKSPRALHVLNHGWWRLAVGSWRRLAVGSWQLAVGGGWRRWVNVHVSPFTRDHPPMAGSLSAAFAGCRAGLASLCRGAHGVGHPQDPVGAPPCSDPEWRETRLTHRGVLKGRDFFFWLRTPLKDRPKGPPTANRQLPSTANRHQPPPTAANRQRRPTANCQPLPTATNHRSPTTSVPNEQQNWP